MTLKKITRKITIRKVGRSLYALIPVQIVKELKITEGHKVTVLIDNKKKIFAYSLIEET